MRESLKNKYNNKINMNLLQIVDGCRGGETWSLMVMCGLFVSKMGKRKNRIVSRDCAMAAGEFAVNKMWILMASTTGEPLANGDE